MPDLLDFAAITEKLGQNFHIGVDAYQSPASAATRQRLLQRATAVFPN